MNTDDKVPSEEQAKKSGSTKITAKIGKVGGGAKISRLILKNAESTENLDSGKKADLDVEIKQVEKDVTIADTIKENSQSPFKELQDQMNPVKKILILSANPEDTNRLRLDKEVREIEEGLMRAKKREQFDIKSKWAVRFLDLRRALLDYKPQIVHFAGHGKKDGLMVEGELGIPVPVSPEALSGLFELCCHHVECVILNACHSKPQADAINKHIKYVIGMHQEINDRAAIEFAVGFYDALCAGEPVEEAFKFGRNAILQEFPDQHEHLIPVLKKDEHPERDYRITDLKEEREKDEMTYQRKSHLEVLVEKLDRELIARTAQMPGVKPFEFDDGEGTPGRDTVMEQVKELYFTAPASNSTLSHISTRDLAKMLAIKTRELNRNRGIWGRDSRVDYYDITDEQIKKNADCTAAICMKDSLTDTGNGFFTLRSKIYRKAFNLCHCEPFHHQHIAAGRMYSGFLVKDNIIATAGHCADEKNVTDLRFVFGYRMSDPSTPVTQVPKKNVYRGVKLINRAYQRAGGSDWALVQLDRKVVGQEVAALSKRELFPDRPVYIIGYPVGLPLKYSPGASVSDIGEASFSADLNVYCSSSGSPVFDSETHEVIGIVVRGDNQDFRLVEKCWISVIYSRSAKCTKEPQCTRVSEFIESCR